MKFFLAVLLFSVGLINSCSGLRPKSAWTTEKWFGKAKSQYGEQKVKSGNHFIYRRQSDSGEIPSECLGEVNRLLCQTGLLEDVVRVALNCGRDDEVDSSAALCDTNAAGVSCGVYDITETILIPAQDECLLSPLGDSCPSMECANSLEALRNSPPGCCVDALFNVTDSPVDNSVLDYTLWSQCGVELFEKCQRTISTALISNATTCTDEEFIRQMAALQCTSGRFDSILDQVEEMELGLEQYVEFTTFRLPY